MMSPGTVVGTPEVKKQIAKPACEKDRPLDQRSSGRVVSAVRVIDANDPGSVLADVEPGMTVIGSSLAKLGVVAKVFAGETAGPIAIAVSYGILTRKRKYVPGEFVDLVDDSRVVLSIDQHQFKTLRDIGE